VVRSASRQTTYPWLGRTTKFREWLGDRVIQALETHEYTIVNRNFEDTVAIDRNDIEDDTYGAYEPIIEQLGWDTKVHPDMLLFAMIKDAVANPGDVVGFDGVPFFSASHPVGLMNQAGTPTANINSSGSGAYWYLIDASRVIRPFIFQLRREYAVTRMTNVADEAVFNRREFRYGVDGRANTGVGLWQLAYASNTDLSNPTNYGAARAAMRAFKTDAGQPFGALSSRTGVYLLVPPTLEEVARQLLNSEFMAGTGASANVATSNIWRNSADLIVSEFLA
jgi:phage major head subunit gpT-like protein